MATKIKPPRMRIGRRIKKDEVFKVKVRFEHPSFTGLGQVDTETDPPFNRAIPVTFIRNMLVYYGDGRLKPAESVLYYGDGRLKPADSAHLSLQIHLGYANDIIFIVFSY